MRGDIAPDGWKVCALEDLADVNPDSLGAGTPPEYGFRYIDLSAVDSGRIDWSHTGEMLFRSAPSRARRMVAGGDVLFGTVRPALQSHGAIPQSASEVLIASTGFAVLRARAGVSEGRFLLHYVLSRCAAEQGRRFEVGSNYPAVNESDVRRFTILAPPLPEQRRIAEILDTLDEAISKTEQLIAKLKQLKQGLLHDLLTRGIDENGEIRDPERHPEQFRESPLGRLPSSWQVSAVEAEFEIISGIALGPHRQPKHRPWPYLRVANVYRDRLDLSDIAAMELLSGEPGARQLRAGDLLVVEGHANPAEIGRCALANREVTGYTFQNHLFCLRPRRLLSRYALQWLNSQAVQAYWRRECATSSGLNTINRTKLGRVTVVVPLPSEQERIVSCVKAAGARIEAETGALRKLHVLKEGLMEDLLTGRVRVSKHETAA